MRRRRQHDLDSIGRCAVNTERHIVISADLEANPGTIRVDLGTMAPHVAFAVLQQALDALESAPGAEVEVLHQGEVVPLYEVPDDAS